MCSSASDFRAPFRKWQLFCSRQWIPRGWLAVYRYEAERVRRLLYGSAFVCTSRIFLRNYHDRGALADSVRHESSGRVGEWRYIPYEPHKLAVKRVIQIVMCGAVVFYRVFRVLRKCAWDQ